MPVTSPAREEEYVTLLSQSEEINCREARAYDRMPNGMWLFRCKRNGAKTDKEKCKFCTEKKLIKEDKRV